VVLFLVPSLYVIFTKEKTELALSIGDSPATPSDGTSRPA